MSRIERSPDDMRRAPSASATRGSEIRRDMTRLNSSANPGTATAEAMETIFSAPAKALILPISSRMYRSWLSAICRDRSIMTSPKGMTFVLTSRTAVSRSASAVAYTRSRIST